MRQRNQIMYHLEELKNFTERAQNSIKNDNYERLLKDLKYMSDILNDVISITQRENR